MSRDHYGQVGTNMSDDPRAVRTRATLKQALMQLLQQGDWSDITASAICRRAGVARSSFYEHFDTKADLLDEIFSDMLGGIKPSTRPSDPLATLDWLVSHVRAAPDFFAGAMAGKRGDALLPRFRAALKVRLELELTLRGVQDASANAAYIIGGSMSYLAEAKGGEVREAVQKMAMRLLV
ncbi:TetR/AcrR family transcriptional regulator [Rhizobium leguminosarum]|uniref:TetR/AcrR family transcriptional regulator n=1 Tax=Rhizobium leguminosarum TaxID=384 RepID=UPI001031EF4C|nr:TetR/AcrR family transcriptional regulator [Rhizobium leguminosarum]TAX54640.1 TetR/AcrR family transcriptional regulator [Rhizobium leguminosarum]TAY00505.1 TetR/AcrR family transcriptional regulator [Rhizobium leguminosarum]